MKKTNLTLFFSILSLIISLTCLSLFCYKNYANKKKTAINTDTYQLYLDKENNCSGPLKYALVGEDTIYTYCLNDIKIEENRKNVTLKNYISNHQDAISNLEKNMIVKSKGRDGGTVVYENDYMTLIHCHKLLVTGDYNNDIYIVPKEIKYPDNICDKDVSINSSKAQNQVSDKVTNSNPTTSSKENDKSQNKTENNLNENTSASIPVKNDSTDSKILEYVDEKEKSLEDTSEESNLKKTFVTLIDFLFYDGTIKGYTFDNLSDKAKLKVLKVSLAIDAKIENYFPNYKTEISQKTNRIYTNCKEKIVAKYLEITMHICTNDPDTCESAKNDFQDMKKSFSITFDIIKGLIDRGVGNLKEWYEIYSGK